MKGNNPILVASGNKNKFQELSTVAKRFGITLVDPETWCRERSLSSIPMVEESGTTYLENALIKARAFSKWSSLASVADDSGLEVLALDNRPGIHSARYGGEGLDYQERMSLLLREIHELEQKVGKGVDRTAYFCCNLAYVIPDEGIPPITVEERQKGTIIDEFRGSSGFGYDPIVLIDELNATLAEVDFSITCTKGFRAKAAKKLFNQLIKINTVKH